MRKSKLFLSIIIIALLVFTGTLTFNNTAETISTSVLARAETDLISDIIYQNMAEGRIPGLSVVIIKNGEPLLKEGFGYSDVRNRVNVTPSTVFELSSNSKAFTALAILQLERDGLVNLTSPVEEYIPWLTMMYGGERVSVTVEQVMNHTSGIPFSSIDNIRENTSDTALEEVVRTLAGIELQSMPGASYSYATINYNILGFIIETVTGQSFEAYVTENIFNPLGLRNTYMFHDDVPGEEMSKGYMISFLRAREFDAPIFRGNKPAGYILSNANDMEIWLKTHLGLNDESMFDFSLITRSHSLDSPIAVEGAVYSAGWFVNRSTSEIFHGGNNPNFSSHIAMNIGSGTGVAVLANLNSSFTEKIAIDIMNILHSAPITGQVSDFNLEMDRIAIALLGIAVLVILLIVFFAVRLILQLLSRERTFVLPSSKGLAIILISMIFIGALGIAGHNLPVLFFGGISWRTVGVWSPPTVIYAAIAIAMAVILTYLFLIADLLLRQKDKKPYFRMIALSIISGIGNAMIIFMINAALTREVGFHADLLMFFILGLFTYLGAQVMVRPKIIEITNQIVYEMRVELINKLLKTSHENVEKLEGGIIQSTLNNDTETISNFANIIIAVVTHAVTIIACFVYLGFVNILALLISVVTIVVIASIYFLAIQKASKLLEAARSTQNIFFKFIDDMNKGFKELRLNINRRNEFEEDVKQLSDVYRVKRGKAFLTFAHVLILGELVFTLAIGFLVFMIPIILRDIQGSELRSFVFILLYLTGPVNTILNNIPNLVQIRVSFGRVKKLIKEISDLSEKNPPSLQDKDELTKISLSLKDVEYEYNLENMEKFKVGPINLDFEPGEITFITGGNGSGKSTLAKLLTGLYRVQAGEIMLNGENITTEDLEQKYAAIFSDFHIFDKLYGIDYESKMDEFMKYLDIMQLTDKIELKEGSFNTTKLSTGQRKRLALAISYLEDRPAYLFDEWAADQDPEFREFFYKELLPEFKKKGKCVIVITHDDRYFDLADKLIKMELGQVASA